MGPKEFKALLTLQIITLIVVLFILFANLKTDNTGSSDEVQKGGEIEQKVTIGSNKNYVYGDTTANNFLMVFSRYNCDFCRKFYSTTFDTIVSELAKKGKLKIICKDLIGPEDVKGMLMAKVAEVARQTGNFEAVHKLLCMGPEPTDSVQIIEMGLKGGIPSNELAARLNAQPTLEKLRRDYEDAKKLGIEMTPSFVLNGQVQVGYIYYSDLLNKLGLSEEPTDKSCNIKNN